MLFFYRILSAALLISLPGSLQAHGYLSYPAARQYKCFRDNNFWWPETGENIPDDACRTAYQTVYAKYRNLGESHGVSANAAQYMFQQYFEYAALAGADYENEDHIRLNVVPRGLCAAGAVERTHAFGDKSGIDTPLAIWRPDVLYNDGGKKLRNTPPHRHREGLPLEILFCPTVVHEPSYFKVYISNSAYNYSAELAWKDLIELPLAGESSLATNEGADESCTNSQIYKIPVVVPWRKNKFVLYVRWQRHDVAGEGFYNCADVVFDSGVILPPDVNVKDEL